MANIVPIVFCFDKRIILGASVSIKSLIDYANSDTIYDIRIFHSDLDNKTQNNLKELISNTRHTMKFHYIDENVFKNAPCNTSSWTRNVYYRLLTPEILQEYDKAIYSDVDVLFKSDLSELYNTDLTNYEVGAIPTCTNISLKTTHPKRYFEENKNKNNYVSGFLLFNNKLMREEKTVDKFLKTIKTYKSRLVFFDMDCLNLTCTRFKELPLSYVTFESLYETTDVTKISEYSSLKTIYSDEYLIETKNNPHIIHFAGKLGKPWQRKWVPEYYQEYVKRIPKNLVRYSSRDIRKRFFAKDNYPQQHFDVGIVNFYHTQNYGACLTAYALQEILKTFNLQPAFVNEFKLKEKYYHSFGTRFVNRYLKTMPRFNDIKRAGKLADIFITGSDQVLRPQYLKKKNERDKYLLNFVHQSAKKIAYSSSFGVGLEGFKESKPVIKQDIQKALQTFDYISVRENVGKDICAKELGIYAEHLLDPIFVVNKDVLINLARNSKSNTNYSNKIVTYILDKYEEYDNLNDKLKNKYNLEIVNLAKSNISVEEWVKAFIEAKYILTDSFHGACFSILFNKDFMALINKKRGSARFESLQYTFKEDLPFYENVSDIENKDFHSLDWNKINRKVEEEKQKSLKILERELFTKSKNFITNNCSGCSACYNSCPKNAIKMVENNEGFLYPQVNSKLCVDCGLCKKICPNNKKKISYNFKNPKCYALMASDEIRLSEVSSGGVSHVALNHFINKGGYVVGAIFDENYRVIHKVINDKINLEKIKGSKYFQSNTKNVYKEIRTLLEEKKQVLFVGTPCQVAGLKSFLNKEYKNLLTIDIVCHGVPSYKTFEIFISNLIKKEEKIQNINFRDKKQGWNNNSIVKITTNLKEYRTKSKDSSFMVAFLRNLSIRKSCFSCKFQKIPRQGDLTIGDFWKIQKFDKTLDDGKGTSLLLINNNKGSEFFNEIKNEFKTVKEVPISYAIRGNKTLIKPTNINQNRDKFMLEVQEDNFSNLLKKYLGDKFTK